MCISNPNSSNKNECILLRVNCTSIKLTLRSIRRTQTLLSDKLHFLGNGTCQGEHTGWSNQSRVQASLMIVRAILLLTLPILSPPPTMKRTLLQPQVSWQSSCDHEGNQCEKEVNKWRRGDQRAAEKLGQSLLRQPATGLFSFIRYIVLMLKLVCIGLPTICKIYPQEI